MNNSAFYIDQYSAVSLWLTVRTPRLTFSQKNKKILHLVTIDTDLPGITPLSYIKDSQEFHCLM